MSSDTAVTEVGMSFHAMSSQSGCMFMYCVVWPQYGVVYDYCAHAISNIRETVISVGPTKLFSVSVSTSLMFLFG